MKDLGYCIDAICDCARLRQGGVHRIGMAAEWKVLL